MPLDPRIAKCRRAVFQQLWAHYYRHVPFAATIEQAIHARGDAWIEDHVAFRTLPGPHTGQHVLQTLFEYLGYERVDDYRFEDKKLRAFWMRPCDTEGDAKQVAPKIFISELEAQTFSPAFQQVLQTLQQQVHAAPLATWSQCVTGILHNDAAAEASMIKSAVAYLTQGPSWARPHYADYQILKNESEYAAWTYLFGSQINHFTVSVHWMNSFTDIAELGEFIETQLGIPMNRSGGLVKGSVAVQLEQIATLAAPLAVLFQDRVEFVPYGFVEFAQRYPANKGADQDSWQALYQGFVTDNADKIFESTQR